MSGFVALALGMTAVALLWVLVPLLRRWPQHDRVAVQASNLLILRDQLVELERDLGSGTISAEHYARARAELERRALEEGDAAGAQTAVRTEARGGSSTLAAVALGVLMPVGAASLYLWIGEPAGLRPAEQTAAQQVTLEQVEQVDDMVARLAARLEKNPDDPRGWAMLARSYSVMERIPEAVAAYVKATGKITDDAGLYADYADAVAMNQGRRIEGRALELVNLALTVDPLQPKALAMAGTAAFYRRDFRAAIQYWEKLRPLLPPESEMAKSVVGGIAEARELGGIKGPVAPVVGGKPAPGSSAKAQTKPAAKAGPQAAAGGVSGRVTLSPALAGKVAPDDTLFILARAVNGPRIPLAVLRKRVADLPVDFTLDDTLAMSPELKLSGFGEVIVSARISKSGNAISRSGDLQGAGAPVKVGARGVAVVIDGVVP